MQIIFSFKKTWYVSLTVFNLTGTRHGRYSKVNNRIVIIHVFIAWAGVEEGGPGDKLISMWYM